MNRLSSTTAIALVAALPFFSNVSAASLYMHGQSDGNGISVNIETAMESRLASKFIDRNVNPQAGDVTVAAPFIRLNDENQSVTLSNSIVDTDEITNCAGLVMRFFVWMKGDGIEAKDNLWSKSPSVKLELIDGYSNCVATADSLFKTRGTFPWHCYYIDLNIPKGIQFPAQKKGAKASPATSSDFGLLGDILNDIEPSLASSGRKGGIYVTFTNFGGGTAWFGGISYTTISSGNNAKESFDGAYAPNSEYDELPMAFMFGVDNGKAWDFLNGNDVQNSVLTCAGVANYVRESSNDWFQLQCGVANLARIYNASKANPNVKVKFEDGWLDTLAAAISEIQDTETGFWMVDGKPNLMATAAIVNGCYAFDAIPHSDMAIHMSDCNMGEQNALKFPERIIKTLIDGQIPGVPAWSACALMGNDINSDARYNQANLVATAAAMQLLARAAAAVPAESDDYIMAKNALTDAWKYAAANFLMRDGKGLWKDTDASAVPSATGKGFFELLEASPALEDRVNVALPRPNLDANVAGDDPTKVVVRWRKPEDALNSVRIYYAPKPGAGVKAISSRFLVGIIQKGNDSWMNDPYALLRTVAAAARKQWGATPDKAGAFYVDAKLKSLASKLSVVPASKVLKAKAGENISADAEDMAFYAAGVDANGVMSPFFAIGDAIVEDAAADDLFIEENTETAAENSDVEAAGEDTSDAE